MYFCGHEANDVVAAALNTKQVLNVLQAAQLGHGEAAAHPQGERYLTRDHEVNELTVLFRIVGSCLAH